MIRQMGIYSILALPPLWFLTGCTNVEPWDRNLLAKDHMTMIPDPLGAEFTDHMHFAREGTEGATGTSAGGCGCN